jgi:hypothetical protein
MLIGKTAILGLALCLALISDSAHSQRRSQQPGVPQPPTATGQQKANEEQRGTEQLPLIIKVVPTPKTEENSANEAADRERIAESERKKEQSDADIVKYTAELARFTKGLFYATIILGGATIGLLVAAFVQSRDTKRAVAAVEQSAAAAKNSVDLSIKEFVVSHRPHLKVHFARLVPPDKNRPDNELLRLRAKFAIINIGTSEGTITRSAVQLAYQYQTDRPFLPDLPRNDVVEPDIRLYSGMSVTCYKSRRQSVPLNRLCPVI